MAKADEKKLAFEKVAPEAPETFEASLPSQAQESQEPEDSEVTTSEGELIYKWNMLPGVTVWEEFDKRFQARERRTFYAEAPKGYRIAFCNAPQGVNGGTFQHLYNLGYRPIQDIGAVSDDKDIAARKGIVYAPGARTQSFSGTSYVVKGGQIMMIIKQELYEANQAREAASIRDEIKSLRHPGGYTEDPARNSFTASRGRPGSAGDDFWLESNVSQRKVTEAIPAT